MTPFHEPVMMDEVVDSLCCRRGMIILDGTLGGGGHARAVLERTAPDGLLIGIDADADAIREAGNNLAPYGGRAILTQGNFADMESILARLNIEKVDGILLDLGVSSHQLDTAERGFSFSTDAPLDMRMDRRQGTDAADLVRTLSAKALERIIRDYGEEIMAGRVARAIAARREISPIETTADLAAVVLRAFPHQRKPTRIHPATRTFQALRIAGNDELAKLERALTTGMERLKPGGRLSVISFHSLEDRIVKNAFRAAEKGCQCPSDLPRCACGVQPTMRVLTRKPIIPSEREIQENPRSRSAKLRTAERI